MLLNTTGNCCKRKYFNNISPLLYRLIIIFPLHNSVVQDDVTARRNHTVKIIAADPRTSDFHFSSKHWSPSIPFLYYSNGCSTKTYSLQETNWHFKTCLGGKRNTFSCGHCTIQNASWAEICRHLNRRNLPSFWWLTVKQTNRLWNCKRCGVHVGVTCLSCCCEMDWHSVLV